MRLVDHLSVAADRSALAAILDAQGRHVEAMVPLHEALTMVEAELGPDHYEVAALLITIAGVAARADETPQAPDAYSRALKIQRRVLGAGHADVRETLDHLDALRSRW
jgi:Tfp pilus assembly protein PilF